MKNVVKLDNYYSPKKLEQAVADFVNRYKNHRYHESINKLTPADVYFGSDEKILTERKRIKKITIKKRKQLYLKNKLMESTAVLNFVILIKTYLRNYTSSVNFSLKAYLSNYKYLQT